MLLPILRDFSDPSVTQQQLPGSETDAFVKQVEGDSTVTVTSGKPKEVLWVEDIP